MKVIVIGLGKAGYEHLKTLKAMQIEEVYGWSLTGKTSEDIKKLNVKIPNYNFDLCRLAITILDVINFDKKKNYKENQLIINFIYNMTCDKYGNSLYDLDDDFDMYISIAKKAEFALPTYIIQNFIFKEYRVKKKKFPKKSYYTLC